MDGSSENSKAASFSPSTRITLISSDRLRVLNPRTRNALFFSQLVENIAMVGLKRPISVARGGSDDEGDWYEVLCGQGRFEALKHLGETMIPCCIFDAPQVDRYLISLTENIARRRHTTEELLSGIQVLRSRGYNSEQIARKTNLDASYITSILHLLDNGEQRLVRAVEKRVVPIWLAVEISRASSEDVQKALLEAYEQGTLKGEQLLRVRKLISKREALGKTYYPKPTSVRDDEKPTPQKLLRIYKTEVRRQQLNIQKARIQEERLLLITSAMRRFLSDDHFRTLLRAERIVDIPEAIARRIPPEMLP
ncbi:ParB family chromosome partitioning protein [Paraburkholderia bannensis]|uniref:ParB family chromosome partitioning protein n=1 Tax=Paraburkholderia bannensis TaxID=765414 RepID=A0A7W9TV51_9BURK|nr:MULTISPECIES: plasmid partitioning protein RepB C-terminal domain-containing protein [Paraburkholderia]MBB3256226.1 ParB family chromosome partitioning protein [Paraburkholderia sp. WP4_3_2]MBB6101226.1 ParB family chromosome partitioning protein [Paraburkholderia bannensis]